MEFVRRVVVAALLVVGASSAYAAVTEVTTCGQTFTGNGILTGNLDCSAFPSFAVTIGGNGALNLAGFTLTAEDAVSCVESSGCTVTSSLAGGTLAGTGPFGIGIEYVNALDVSDVTIRNFHWGTTGRGLVARNVAFESNGNPGAFQPGAAIATGRGTLTIEDCTFSDNARAIDGGTAAPGITTAIIRRSTFSGNQNGESGMLRAYKLTIEDSTVSGTMKNPAVATPSLSIISASKAKIRNVQFDTNDGAFDCVKRCTLEDVTFTNAVTDWAVVAGFEGKVRADRVTISTAIGDGFNVRTVKLRDSSIAGVSGNGVSALKVKVEDSVISGSGAAGARATDRIGGVAGKSVGGKAVIKRSEVTGNGIFGVVAEITTSAFGDCSRQIRAKISDSVVTGNGTDAGCGTTLACADAAGCQLVRVSGSTVCDTSYDTKSGVPGTSWGVCAAD